LRATATTDAPAATAADTIAVGVFAGEEIAHDVDGGALAALLERGEAKRTFKHVALVHADGRRWLVVGLGERERFDAERARVAAATAHARAREVGGKVLCWEVPHRVDDAVVGGLVDGTLLAAYRFRAFKSGDDDAGGEGLDVSSSAPTTTSPRPSPARPRWPPRSTPRATCRTRRPTT